MSGFWFAAFSCLAQSLVLLWSCPFLLSNVSGRVALTLAVSRRLRPPSEDGEYCLSGGHDKLVKLWNPQRGRLIKTYTGHGREVAAIAVYVPPFPLPLPFCCFPLV